MVSRGIFRTSLAGRRAWPLAAFALWFVSTALFGGGAWIYAQDDLKEAQQAEVQSGGAPAAQPAAAPAAPASTGSSTPAKDEGKQQSQLQFFYHALGMRYTVAFLFISFCFVALLVMNTLALRRDAVCPHVLVEQFEAHLNEKRYQEAYELARHDESFLGRVLSSGLAKLSSGYGQAVEAMQGTGEEEIMKLEQRLSYIALIGTVAPMVGLLGTVDGMVVSFRVIAESDTQPKPSELADGISMALITTLVGLWLAIPAVAFFGFFRNRLARLVFEAASISEQLMNRFSGPQKKA